MRTKEFVGRRLLSKEIVKFNYRDCSEDYGCPCFRIIPMTHEYYLEIERDDGYHYFEIITDEAYIIKRIERYFECYLSSLSVTRFPLCVEEEMEEILTKVTRRE